MLKFEKLDILKNLDTLNWEIPYSEILTPIRNVDPYLFLTDYFYENETQKFACLFYTIFEARMGWQVGLIALFENKVCPKLIANPYNIWFDWQGKRSLYFFDDLLFLRKPFYFPESNLSSTPFIKSQLKKIWVPTFRSVINLLFTYPNFKKYFSN